MDPRRFDFLVKALAASGSRRRALGALLVGSVGAALPNLTAADKGKNRKKKSRDRKQKHRKRRQTQAEAIPPGCCSSGNCTPGAGKNLSKCCYEGQNLAGKTFKGANLDSATFKGATLTTANFNSANLGKTCFVDANLTGAKFAGANTGTAVFCRTTMPDGSVNDSGCGKGTNCCPTCDEEHLCADDQVCCGGRCRPGDCCVAADCNGNPDPQCRTASCQTNRCSYPPVGNGATCDDGNACTLNDTCQGGSCTGGNPVVCTPSDQCHLAGTCNPATGVCTNPNKPNGASCETGNLCTIDTCQGGVCTTGPSVTCTTPGPCESNPGTCDPTTGTCTYATTCSASLQQICCPPGTSQAGICGNANGIGCFNGSTCCSGQCAGPATPTSDRSCGPPPA